MAAMQPPYPIEIPPLLSQFLTRRRTRMTFPLRQMEELGLDRPAYFWVINLSYRGDKGASRDPGDLESAYSTIPESWMPMAAAARGAGLAEERGDRWYLTAKGRQVALALHRAAREHYGTLEPIRADELAELARLLDRAFKAAAKAPLPRPRIRTPFAFGYRGDEPAEGSFAQLDAAIYGLWQVRDDAHLAAWRASGMTGPVVEVLTRIWRSEAADETALIELLTHQRPDDVREAIAALRAGGRVETATLRATKRGAADREAIENETDRLFFAPWPDDVGARGSWIATKLAEVNAALARA